MRLSILYYNILPSNSIQVSYCKCCVLTNDSLHDIFIKNTIYFYFKTWKVLRSKRERQLIEHNNFRLLLFKTYKYPLKAIFHKYMTPMYVYPYIPRMICLTYCAAIINSSILSSPLPAPHIAICLNKNSWVF